MTAKHLRRSAAILLILHGLCATPAGAGSIDEIVVTADLRGRTTRDLPASVTLLEQEDIEAQLQDLEARGFRRIGVVGADGAIEWRAPRSAASGETTA